MTRNDLENESILTLCKMNRSIFYAIREEAESRLKEHFRFSAKKEIRLNNPICCSFWNRGFDIKVDRIFIERNNIYVGGKNFNGTDTSEFFSYIFGDFSLEQLFEEISKQISL